MESVGSVDELLRGSEYVYHVTDTSNIPSIRKRGIDPSVQSDQWTRMNEFLSLVAAEEHISTGPSNRAECVFSFPRFADAADYDVGSDTVFVIDLRKVDGPMYFGSYHAATELHEILTEKQANTPTQILDSRAVDSNAQFAYEKAIEYWESVSQASPPVSRGGELLIEAHISPEAIVQYIE